MENCFVPVLKFLGSLLSFSRKEDLVDSKLNREVIIDPKISTSFPPATSQDSPAVSVYAEDVEYYTVPYTDAVEYPAGPPSPLVDASFTSTLVDDSSISPTELDWQFASCLLPIAEEDESSVYIEEEELVDEDVDDEDNSSTPFLSFSPDVLPIEDPLDSAEISLRFLPPSESDDAIHVDGPSQSDVSSIQLLPVSPNPTPNEESFSQAPFVDMFNRVYESYRLLQNSTDDIDDDDGQESESESEAGPENVMADWDWQWEWADSSRVEAEVATADEEVDNDQNNFPFARFPEVYMDDSLSECSDCVDEDDDDDDMEDEEDDDDEEEEVGPEEHHEGVDSAEALNEPPRHTRIFRTDNIMVIAVFRPSNTLLLVIDRLGLISTPGSLPGLEAIFGIPQLQGQPPASKEAVDSLPVVDVTGSEERCLICQENLYCPDEHEHDECDSDNDAENGSPRERTRCLQMPCNHIFHEHELKEWLRRSNSCPACRYELMTANPEYNETVRQRMEARNREVS